MLTADQRASFERDGFVIVPAVLSSEQVLELRRALGALFATRSSFEGDIDRDLATGTGGNTGCIRFDVCARYPELRWLLTHPPLVGALRGLLGDDFLYLPEMSAHYRGFGHWHKDTTSQERAGERFHWEPDYLMVEAALYLQANCPEYGGGLDVVPGSHRQPDTYLNAVDRTVFDRARTKLKTWGLLGAKKAYSIPSKPGDLVIFDFRLDHRATWPSARQIPADREKLALFFACSRNDRHARRYVEYIASRPDYVYLRDHTYPAEMLEVVGRERLLVSSE